MSIESMIAQAQKQETDAAAERFDELVEMMATRGDEMEPKLVEELVALAKARNLPLDVREGPGAGGHSLNKEIREVRELLEIDRREEELKGRANPAAITALAEYVAETEGLVKALREKREPVRVQLAAAEQAEKNLQSELSSVGSRRREIYRARRKRTEAATPAPSETRSMFIRTFNPPAPPPAEEPRPAAPTEPRPLFRRLN